MKTGFKNAPGDVVKQVLQRVHPLAKFGFSPLLSTAVSDEEHT